MQSGNYLINMGILNHDIKRFGWIGIIYFLGLFFLMPLQIIMLQHTYSAEAKMYYDIYTYLRVLSPNYSPFLLLLLFIMPVLTGVLLFRYLQTGDEVSFHHVLPFKRETLYHTHMLSGLIILLAPVIVTWTLVLLLIGIYDINVINVSYLYNWLFLSILINLVMFFICVMVGTVAGMSVLQVLLTFILVLLPSGLGVLTHYNLDFIVYGWATGYYERGLENFSPLLRLPTLYGKGFMDYTELFIYVILLVIVYFLGLYFYKKRKLERAGEAITFDILREVFRYGVVFCFMLLMGIYFGRTQSSTSWLYFGYIVGSILAYIGVEILLARSLDVFKLRIYKGYGVYALAVIVIMAGINFDILGYEKKVPALEQVKSVYFDNSLYALLMNKEKEKDIGKIPEESDKEIAMPPLTVFKKKNNIESVIRLHSQIVANREENKNSRWGNNWRKQQQVCLAYELNDGSFIYRQYTIPNKSFDNELKPVYESLEYKKLHYAIYRLSAEKVQEMSIRAYETDNVAVVIRDKKLISEAIEVLKKDIEAMAYEDMFKPGKTSWASIDFSIGNEINVKGGNYNLVTVEWEKSFTNFADWLKKVGKYEQARVMPQRDVTYVLVKKIEDNDKLEETWQFEKDFRDLKQWEKQSGVKKLDSTEEIEWCLNNYLTISSVYEASSILPGYLTVFVTRDGRTFSGIIPGYISKNFLKEIN